MDNDEILFTIPQCCRILQCGRTHLYRYLDRQLRVTRIGGNVRVHRDDLLKFIEDQRLGQRTAEAE